jgi:foldase protein PrsA
MSKIKENKKTFLIIFVLIATMAVLLSFALKKNEAVAKFNGEAISKDDLYNEMVELYGPATVNQ